MARCILKRFSVPSNWHVNSTRGIFRVRAKRLYGTLSTCWKDLTRHAGRIWQAEPFDLHPQNNISHPPAPGIRHAKLFSHQEYLFYTLIQFRGSFPMMTIPRIPGHFWYIHFSRHYGFWWSYVEQLICTTVLPVLSVKTAATNILSFSCKWCCFYLAIFNTFLDSILMICRCNKQKIAIFRFGSLPPIGGHAVSSLPYGICFLSWLTTDFRLVVIAPYSNFKRSTRLFIDWWPLGY